MTSRPTNMCGNGHNERPHLAMSDGLTNELVIITIRADNASASTALLLRFRDWDDVPVHLWTAADSDGHGKFDNDVHERTFSIRYCPRGVFTAVGLARDV